MSSSDDAHSPLRPDVIKKPKISTSLTSEELKEVDRIIERLNRDEAVEMVAKQGRFKVGGETTTPDTLFVTDKRLIIRDPSLWGARESIESIAYDKITAIELEKGVFSSKIVIKASGYSSDINAIQKDIAKRIVDYIKDRMQKLKGVENQGIKPIDKSSIADEISKLARLRVDGIISEKDFQGMKDKLIRSFNED